MNPAIPAVALSLAILYTLLSGFLAHFARKDDDSQTAVCAVVFLAAAAWGVFYYLSHI